MGSKKKPKYTFETKNGSIYKGEPKDGKLRVFTTRTAPGQLEIRGVFNLATREWHNDDELPSEIRAQVEAATFV